MTGAAVDEEDELLLDFCRLAVGAAALADISNKVGGFDISEHLPLALDLLTCTGRTTVGYY